jgi:hypothetical protein
LRLYIRVSTEAQNTARQEEALEQLKLEKIFIDKASGKDAERPQLTAALAHLREGDTFTIYSMDRLSRSFNDLITTVKSLTVLAGLLTSVDVFMIDSQTHWLELQFQVPLVDDELVYRDSINKKLGYAIKEGVSSFMVEMNQKSHSKKNRMVTTG